jgi:hypothetical protein
LRGEEEKNMTSGERYTIEYLLPSFYRLFLLNGVHYEMKGISQKHSKETVASVNFSAVFPKL